MRTRTRTVQVPGTHTINGQTMPVIREQQIVEPVPPRDWDVIATHAAIAVIVVLTTFSVVWSTASIARLLGGGWAATLAAATFDAAWIVTGVIAYLVRHQPDRRAVVDRGGWALVTVTVTAIGVEGWQTDGLAAACAGATVSLIAKGLWWMFDRATRAPLSSDDRQWLAGRRSQLGAQRALLAMQRQVSREQARIAVELGPGPDRPRGSTRPADPTPQVDPTPALESTPNPAVPAVEASPDPAPPRVDPAPRSTRPAGRPDLHAVPDRVDPDELAKAKAVVAELRGEGIAPSTEQIRRRMRINRDRVRALWLAIQVAEADEADPSRRTA